MKNEKIMEILPRLFVPLKKGPGSSEDGEGVCFRSEYMREESEAYAIYKAVSDAQYKSGLTFDFSYDVANRAVDVLCEVEDWDNNDAISEAVDSAVPIYTGEIMKIYQANSWAVNDSNEEYGKEGDVTQQGMMAWYLQIYAMVRAIKDGLHELVDSE